MFNAHYFLIFILIEPNEIQNLFCNKSYIHTENI